MNKHLNCCAKITISRLVRGLALITFITSFSLLFISNANADQLLESRESSYNNIYIYKRGSIITMTFGYNKRLYVESEFNQENERELPVVYTRYMTVGLAYAKAIDSILEIGLGGGRTSWYIHKTLPNTSITTVELDPEVISLAKKYFRIRQENNFDVVARDGRIYLARNANKYDVILIDAYRGPFVPFHLLTKEFYSLVKSKLEPGGVTVQNIEPSTMLFDAAIVTMKSVFNNIDLFEAGGNVVTVAYDGPMQSNQELAQKASNLQKKYKFFHNLSGMIGERKVLSNFPSGKPLTDDFAPVEYLKGIKKHNEKWN
jgi:spermidine synthase